MALAPDALPRCGWVHADPVEIAYHDTEWGVPLHCDRKHFEFIILDGFQAGLSWITILRKRENFRAAFDDFDPAIVAGYDETKHQELLQNTGIVRNRLKIAAATLNAQAFLKVQETFGSFDRYIWQFVDGETVQNAWPTLADAPTRTAASENSAGLSLWAPPFATPTCRQREWSTTTPQTASAIGTWPNDQVQANRRVAAALYSW